MYAIALLRYRRPLEEVLPVSDALLLRLPGELLPCAPNIGLEALEQL